ncbi:MAG: hypothetical protein FP831_12225 [Anaerolineae bacterium]|nr:hypothetical protein [Anaerolineae bacterium]
MKMNKRPKFLKFLVLVLLVALVLSACKPGTDNIGETQAALPEPVSTPAEILTVEIIETEQNTSEASPPGFIRQGAVFGVMDMYQAEEVATGGYDPAVPQCGDSWLASFSEDYGENVITLLYQTPVIPTEIELFTNSKPETIVRVELLNSFTGLAVFYDESQPPQWKQSAIQGACETSLKLEIETDIEVDTIFIEFTDLASASQLDAVELSGLLNWYTDPLIYWRVPLPDTPVDMVVNPMGEIFVAAGMNGLYKFDLEGNQLDKMPAPDQADVMSLEADISGNLFVADSAFGWLVVFDSEGIQTDAGGEGIFGHLGYNPADDNLYLLRGNTIEVYSTDAVALIRQIQLDDLHAYTKLTFDSGGRMFLLRDHDWDATLVEMDPLTGEELDAFPLVTSNQQDIVAKDLTVDAQGNFYILFSMNTGDIAVHMLDPRGSLIQRFGHLSYDAEGWTEGSFREPKAISVTPDGRFLIIIDGYEEQSYLSAFLLEIDE